MRSRQMDEGVLNAKNPYNTSLPCVRSRTSFNNDNDVGFVNWSTSSGTQLKLKFVLKISDNHSEMIIDVTE